MIMQENACIIRNKEVKDSITAMNSTTLRILSTARITYCMVNSLRKIAFLSVINRRDAPPVSPNSQTETANSMFHPDQLRRHSYYTRIKVLPEVTFLMRCIF